MKQTKMGYINKLPKVLHVMLVSDCSALIKNIAMAIAIETFKLASLLTNLGYWSQQGLFQSTTEESK